MRGRSVATAALAVFLCVGGLAPGRAGAHEDDPVHTLEYLLDRILGPVLDLLSRGVDPEGPAIDPTAAAGCDLLDPTRCLLPFPNDFFTVADDRTDTGRRVSFSLAAMPRNAAGKPIDPTEWNRNDGFSPGAMVLTLVPGIDLEKTGAPSIIDPARSLDPSSPILILDAATGDPHPFFAELDRNQGATLPLEDLAGEADVDASPLEPVADLVRTPATQDHERLLILRPLVNFEEGARYVVALRNVKDASGNVIPPGPAFAALRDPLPVDPFAATPRRSHYEDDVFPVLANAGIAREDLYLAWDFTVASVRSLSERVLHIRDEAFRSLAGGSPAFTVDTVTELEASDPSRRRVEGTFTVPSFLSLPGGPTGSTFNYVGTPDGNLPARFPGEGTLTASYTCNIPRSAPGIPSLYGHGLLGSRGEGNSGHVRTMGNEGRIVFCATDWIGMSGEDIATVATIIADFSNFPKLADRSQQGFLNFMFLGRAMIHPDGFCGHAAFQDENGDCLIDLSTEQLYYDGNSQGAIMGGALAAVAHDVRRGVLGVPGMNYSTLLNRSVDWEGFYAFPFYVAYPDKIDQQIAFALVQMLWDRAEANGYAHHMTDDPYIDPSPEEDPFHAAKTVLSAKGAKQILLHVAFADHQVANLAAEVEARTIGARIIGTSLDKSEHWETSPFFGLEEIPGVDLDPAGAGASGSAIVYWHNGNNKPPNENVPPDEECNDPHESPRRQAEAIEQKRRFFHDRAIFDTCGGVQCETTHRRNCVDGQPN